MGYVFLFFHFTCVGVWLWRVWFNVENGVYSVVLVVGCVLALNGIASVIPSWQEWNDAKRRIFVRCSPKCQSLV